MDEIVELGIVIGDGYSRSLQRLESLTVDTGRTKDIFFENHPYVHSSFFRIFEGLKYSFLGEYVYFYKNLIF